MIWFMNFTLFIHIENVSITEFVLLLSLIFHNIIIIFFVDNVARIPVYILK